MLVEWSPWLALALYSLGAALHQRAKSRKMQLLRRMPHALPRHWIGKIRSWH
jgi:hypothetical protein